MAEFVEINKEKAIQEYEEMGKLKFFNDEEIKYKITSDGSNLLCL